ncbi:hypothetical protein C2E23DRAFT_816713 [Lenzites betulinus]|nr:hypothetical protein C2E23DRAFT_816713 [Lenzites betulinus]
MNSCFYCQKKTDDVKRCSRCRLVTYCSKECREISWKRSHKKTCKLSPHLFDADGKPKAEASEFGSPEWVQAKVDKELSKWLEYWRRVFCMYATIALDLANHPPERVVTHCLTIRIQPVILAAKRYQSYCALSAQVESREDIEKMFPDLAPIVTDPTDLTRARFVVILENTKGEIVRVRLNQWNDMKIPMWQGVPKSESRKLADEACLMVVHAVNELDPAEVTRRMGI